MYSSRAFRFLEDVSDKEFFTKIQAESSFFIAREGGREKLFSSASSRGHRDYEGLGWVLIMGHDTQEVLKPAFTLRKNILIFSLVLITASILIAVFIFRSITKPIIKLTQGA
ncbi:MAG: hypothetical protein ACOC7U_02935 [Spirochaetota bacterium]